MVDLLILYSLLDEKSTIYGIKQRIDKLFSLFFNISFGTIHPAIKKLENNNYVNVKKKLSSGGQRSSIYSITDPGIEYFKSLMLEEFPDNPAIANQIINIKIMALLKVDHESQVIIKNSILNYQKIRLLNAQNMLSEIEDNNDKVQNKLIKNFILKISADIDWLHTIV